MKSCKNCNINRTNRCNEAARIACHLGKLNSWEKIPEEKPLCKIINDQFSWVLRVDGKEIPFQGLGNAEYFKEHYEKLGYEVEWGFFKEIETCIQCQHLSHTGAFTRGGSKPCCNHDRTVATKGDDCFKRVIKDIRKIPGWCPLKKGYDY